MVPITNYGSTFNQQALVYEASPYEGECLPTPVIEEPLPACGCSTKNPEPPKQAEPDKCSGSKSPDDFTFKLNKDILMYALAAVGVILIIK